MNAKWLEKFVQYRDTKYTEDACRIILNEKIKRQFHLVQQDYSNYLIERSSPKKDFFIHEARAAHHYWTQWRKEFQNKFSFSGRIPHGKDPINRLLDAGYHFLTNFVQKECERNDIPTELGILHRASSKKSHPLVYDLVEWLRPLVVDKTLYHFLRRNKKPGNLRVKEAIPKVIHACKQKLEKRYFHRERKACITLHYWITLSLLELRGAVTKHGATHFVFPPTRHDTRCTKKRLS